MFGDIARFLIQVVFTLFADVLLVRAWMQAVRLPPRNPLSQSVFQFSDWLVRPLRRVIPATGWIDWACLVGAYLTALVSLLLTFASFGGALDSVFPMVLGIALLTLLKWAVTLVMWATLLMALLSWVNPGSVPMAVLDQLLAPFLTPIRRVLPMFGRLDLSPLVLFLITQILLIVIARASQTLF